MGNSNTRTSSPRSLLLDPIARMNEHEVRQYEKQCDILNIIELEAQRAIDVAGRSGVDIGRKLAMSTHGFSESQPEERRTGPPLSIVHEVSADLEKAAGIPSQGGLMIATRLRASGLDTKSNAAGAYTVGSDVMGIVDQVPVKSTVLRLGATMVPQLDGTTSWPTDTALPTGQWVAENPGFDSNDQDAVFGTVPATPHGLTVSTSVSRRLRGMASRSVELGKFMSGRLAHGLANSLDAAAIAGTGASNQPTGILNTSNVGVVAMGTNGAVVTTQALIDMETTLSAANAVGTGFLTSPAIRAKLRTLPSISSGSVPVWDGDTVLGSYAGAVSTHIPTDLTKGNNSPPRLGCHAVILADWSNLLIAEWGVLELIVDPFGSTTQGKKQGMISLTVIAHYDIAVIRPSAFCVIVDALPA